MSWQAAENPICTGLGPDSPIELTIQPRRRDLGGFDVARVLPAKERRVVGPFVFLDSVGPADFPRGSGIDVRPHPHIGLATVTYLFAGEIIHRDSVGSVQSIRPGDVNWMTAGRGIVHSERTGDEVRRVGAPLHGLQAWVALPKEHEEREPAFSHHSAADLPVITEDGATIRVIAGSGFGARAPVTVFWPTLYADVVLTPGSRVVIPGEYEERAVIAISGSSFLSGQPMPVGELLVVRPGAEAILSAAAAARVMVLGGAALDGPRHMWWNFVSSSKDRIEQAKADWQTGRFPAVPGETEITPLPEA